MNVSNILLIVGISALFIGLAFIVILQFKMSYGSAIEDKGSLLTERLLERAREWNIQKAINETLLIADKYVCFDDLNEYFKFRLENDNKTDYTVVFPCPELDLKTIPKDESNK